MDCKNDGLSQTDDGYEKFQDCQHNCQPEQCPNYKLCKEIVPQWVLDCNHGMCMSCAISFKYPLRFNEKKNICNVCFTEQEVFVKMQQCEHYLCVNCYKKITWIDYTTQPPMYESDDDDEQYKQEIDRQQDIWEEEQELYLQNSQKCPFCRKPHIKHWG